MRTFFASCGKFTEESSKISIALKLSWKCWVFGAFEQVFILFEGTTKVREIFLRVLWKILPENQSRNLNFIELAIFEKNLDLEALYQRSNGFRRDLNDVLSKFFRVYENLE